MLRSKDSIDWKFSSDYIEKLCDSKNKQISRLTSKLMDGEIKYEKLKRKCKSIASLYA